MLAGAAGFEPANAGTKSRRKWRSSAHYGEENRGYPHNEINNLCNECGTAKSNGKVSEHKSVPSVCHQEALTTARSKSPRRRSQVPADELTARIAGIRQDYFIFRSEPGDGAMVDDETTLEIDVPPEAARHVADADPRYGAGCRRLEATAGNLTYIITTSRITSTGGLK